MTMRGSESVVLNGERLKIVVESDRRPKYIPGWVWKWMVRQVVATQRVTIVKK